MRVIIVGAGIGGLSAAIALGREGIDAQVYERAAELREVGAGIGLASNALRVLDVLGLGNEIRSRSVIGVPGCIRNPKGGVLSAIPPGSIAVMHRAELMEVLLGKIDPERLHLGRTFAGFEQDGDGVTTRFENGETARGDALVGADGLRSAVRRQLFGDQPPRYAGYTAWRAVVEFEGGPAIGETWGRGCRFGFLPMSRGRMYWFAVKNAAEGERDPEGGTRDMLLELFRGWHEPIERLIMAAQEGTILRNDIYDRDDVWQGQGRVALLGDAAHPMTPNLGQGACQAMEDAVVLAACLKANTDVEPALREYKSRRTPRVRKFMRYSRRLGIIAQLENAVLCRVRDAALRATPADVGGRRMAALLDGRL